MTKRKKMTPVEVHQGIKEMGDTFNATLTSGNFLSAYVIAFSFLEDRVSAMDAVRGRAQDVEIQGYTSLSVSVTRLRYADDLSATLTKSLLHEAKERNKLVHSAMWNLTAVTRESALRAYKLGGQVSNARRKQKKKLGQ